MNAIVFFLVSLAVATATRRRRRRVSASAAASAVGGAVADEVLAQHHRRRRRTIPTPFPTKSPTESPTQAPIPTPSPTPLPTAAPTGLQEACENTEAGVYREYVCTTREPICRRGRCTPELETCECIDVSAPTPPPTPLPLPARDPGTQCTWYTAGMTWDCACNQLNGEMEWNTQLTVQTYTTWKNTEWFFSPCSRQGANCNDARRRKDYRILCGYKSFGTGDNYFGKAFGEDRDGEDVGNFGDWDADDVGVAVFSIRLNKEEDGGDETKATFWDHWMDQTQQFNLYGVGLDGHGNGNCDSDTGCKCTCVTGANMLGSAEMKALLPYRGPGDKGNYRAPNNSNSDDNHEMYGTYCVGVCGVDCDSAGSSYYGTTVDRLPMYDDDGNFEGNEYYDPPVHANVGRRDQRMHGQNRLYAVLVSHDVCQAYIGSKTSYHHKAGRTNGCGDEAAQNGACYAAEYSMRDYGGSCDTDQEWLGDGWCPDWLQGNN